MAHFAKLDNNNIVIEVLVGRDEDEQKELELSERTGDTYKRTSYNTFQNTHLKGGTPFRGNFAGIGMIYCNDHDLFMIPKCHNEAVLSLQNAKWNCTNTDHDLSYGNN
jgi:hypothetical protein